MKITIFTSNQPRHIAFINRLASISKTTYAVMECNTLFPGRVEDFFKRSEVMQEYFSYVMLAEKKIFGDLAFLQKNVRSLALKSGDLDFMQHYQIIDALDSDLYIVFGASYIKGWLADFLVEKNALNIHMGISPYYRGSSCNFWALFDGNPEYVGATIHMLSRGLDSGPILYHALPILTNENPFEFTMRAVDVAQKSLIERVVSEEIKTLVPNIQNKKNQVRYTKNKDFTDEIASQFLGRCLSNENLKASIANKMTPELINPYFG